VELVDVALDHATGDDLGVAVFARRIEAHDGPDLRGALEDRNLEVKVGLVAGLADDLAGPPAIRIRALVRIEVVSVVAEVEHDRFHQLG
jgi:hypothetical protein